MWELHNKVGLLSAGDIRLDENSSQQNMRYNTLYVLLKDMFRQLIRIPDFIQISLAI